MDVFHPWNQSNFDCDFLFNFSFNFDTFWKLIGKHFTFSHRLKVVQILKHWTCLTLIVGLVCCKNSIYWLIMRFYNQGIYKDFFIIFKELFYIYNYLSYSFIVLMTNKSSSKYWKVKVVENRQVRFHNI
jgi:hypothetical protein